MHPSTRRSTEATTPGGRAASYRCTEGRRDREKPRLSRQLAARSAKTRETNSQAARPRTTRSDRVIQTGSVTATRTRRRIRTATTRRHSHPHMLLLASPSHSFPLRARPLRGTLPSRRHNRLRRILPTRRRGQTRGTTTLTTSALRILLPSRPSIISSPRLRSRNPGTTRRITMHSARRVEEESGSTSRDRRMRVAASVTRSTLIRARSTLPRRRRRRRYQTRARG